MAILLLSGHCSAWEAVRHRQGLSGVLEQAGACSGKINMLLSAVISWDKMQNRLW